MLITQIVIRVTCELFKTKVYRLLEISLENFNNPILIKDRILLTKIIRDLYRVLMENNYVTGATARYSIA